MRIRVLILTVIASGMNSGCIIKPGGVTGGRAPAVPEIGYCAGTQTYAGGVTVTGLVNFEKATADGSGIHTPVTNTPAKFIEISLQTSSGHEINCGETNATGNFSIPGPANTNFRIVARARSFNSSVKVSVLDTPDTNNVYEISTTANGTTAGGTVNATPTNTELLAPISGNAGAAGAFNIQNVIYSVNSQLRTDVTGFTVANKVSVYWKAGLSPAVYIGGSSSSAISFYLTSTSQLYLQGGINGNTTSSDTDQFDDAVIAHEYGHFLEDIYSRGDSPGGSHNGNSIIDPRLAWGEGWANFFSSYARGDSTYRDSIGYGAGSYNAFNINLESDATLDMPTVVNEGNFREMAVAKSLWDGYDTGGSADETSTVSFNNYWTLFTGNFRNGQYFRNVGLFFNLYFTAYGADANLSTALGLASNRINSTNTSPPYYGVPLSTAAYNNMNMNPSGSTSSFSSSNKFANNHYYDYTHSSSNGKINLNYVSNVGGSADLDLYLLADGYVYADTADILKTSATNGSSNECINLTGLTNGAHYMVWIFGNTASGGSGGTTTYNLVPGAGSCP